MVKYFELHLQKINDKALGCLKIIILGQKKHFNSNHNTRDYFYHSWLRWMLVDEPWMLDKVANEERLNMTFDKLFNEKIKVYQVT